MIRIGVTGVLNIIIGLAVVMHLLFISPTVFENTGGLAVGYWLVFTFACILFLLGLIMCCLHLASIKKAKPE